MNVIHAEPTVPDVTQAAQHWEAVLRRDRISHVLVNWHELDRYRSPGNYGYSSFTTRELVRLAVDLVQQPAGRFALRPLLQAHLVDGLIQEPESLPLHQQGAKILGREDQLLGAPRRIGRVLWNQTTRANRHPAGGHQRQKNSSHASVSSLSIRFMHGRAVSVWQSCIASPPSRDRPRIGGFKFQ